MRALIPISFQSRLGLVLMAGFIAFGFTISNTDGKTAALWVVGGLFGFILQRSRLCFASAFRDLFLFGSGHNMKGIIAGLAISSLGFAAVMHWILPNTSTPSLPSEAHIFPAGISVLIGGILFGLGMVLAGGCVSGTLYRIAEGYVASWITLIGILIGLSALTLTWNWWWDTVISNEPTIWLPNLADGKFGYTGGLALTLLLLIVLFIAITFIESKTGIFTPKISKKQSPNLTFTSRIKGSIDLIFKNGWPITIGGVALGGLGVFAYTIHMPLGVTGELMRISHTAMDVIGINIPQLNGLSDLPGCTGLNEGPGLLTHSFAITVGLFFGALIGALLSGEWRPRIPKKHITARISQSLVGGIFMGYAAGLAIGCTIGAFFSAIPSLSVSGWIFGFSLGLGAYIGTKIIRRIG